MYCVQWSAGRPLLPVLQKGNTSLRFLLLLFCCAAFFGARTAYGQLPANAGDPFTSPNAPQRDTSDRKPDAEWRDEPVKLQMTRAFSIVPIAPDTEIHNFQRRPFSQPWYRDLGNLGTAARSQLFLPENLGHTGPSLGYHVYDVYRLSADSLLYYNTTRPYTVFSYQLATKLEQTLRLIHTQNISPRWNFAARYQKVASPGFYRLQRTSHDAASLSTHYSSSNQQYEIFGAAVYNKEQCDENGGILNDSFLSSSRYFDRQTIPVALDNPNYFVTSSLGPRSAITNVLRDFNILLRHQYTLGRRDTVYNADSTQYSINLIPRFSVRHRLEGGSEKQKAKNAAPDSLIYTSFFSRHFASADSVYSVQQWGWLDNHVSLNGFVGPETGPLSFSAGAGLRLDNFYTDYVAGRETSSIISTYVTGDISKESLAPGAWGYSANARFFVAGSAVGNFLANGQISKDFGRRIGSVRAGATLQLSDAPYAYTLYRNQYYRQESSLNKENITVLWGEVANAPLGLTVGIKNYLIGNYIYLQDSLSDVSNGKLQFSQYATAFNLTQLTLREVFHFGHFVLDNELAFQQVTGSAPVSVPLLLGRHAASYESYLFSHALKIATGIEVRYHTEYNAEGYAPFYNRFYYQSSYSSSNKPEFSAFFNFKIKRFRAYLMGDQLQTLFWQNTVVHPGYPSQDMMIRFGFDWVMVN
jgi:hypothetical protein